MSTLKTGALRGTSGSSDTMTIHASDGSVQIPKLKVGSDAAGDVLYHNGTNYVRLAKGTDGQVLTLASGVPSWATPSAGLTYGSGANSGALSSQGWQANELPAAWKMAWWTWKAVSPNSDADLRFEFNRTNGGSYAAINSAGAYAYQYNNNGAVTSRPGNGSYIVIQGWNANANQSTGRMTAELVYTNNSDNWTYYFQFFNVISNQNENAYFSGAGYFDSSTVLKGGHLHYESGVSMDAGIAHQSWLA